MLRCGAPSSTAAQPKSGFWRHGAWVTGSPASICNGPGRKNGRSTSEMRRTEEDWFFWTGPIVSLRGGVLALNRAPTNEQAPHPQSQVQGQCRLDGE